MRCSRRGFLQSVSVASAGMLMGEALGAEEGFVFAQICDTQLGMGGYEHDVGTFRQAVKDLNALKPDFVVICGDLINETKDDKAFADFNEIKAGFEMPCHCAAGNHDITNTPTPELLARYRRIVGKDYFSFEHKGCVFAVVNTQLWKSPLAGESEKHDAWFEGVVKKAAEAKQPVVVVGHYPLFLETPDEKEEYFNLGVEKRGELLGLFEKTGVAAVVTGHTHRQVVNEYKGIQMVSSATTSKNFDGAPFGFRLWHVAETRPYEHEYVALSEG